MDALFEKEPFVKPIKIYVGFLFDREELTYNKKYLGSSIEEIYALE